MSGDWRYHGRATSTLTTTFKTRRSTIAAFYLNPTTKLTHSQHSLYRGRVCISEEVSIAAKAAGQGVTSWTGTRTFGASYWRSCSCLQVLGLV